MENYSLADIATASGANGMGGNSWILIILFALIFGGGGFFGGNRGYEQYATTSDVQRGFDTQDNNGQLRGITYGIADSTYALNNAINTAANNIGGGISDLKTQIESVKYEGAINTASINANTTNQIQKVLDAISTNRMADMQNQINQLQLQNAMCGVIRYPNAATYNAGSPCLCGNVGGNI